jgi:hypothetical protein
MNKTLVFIIVGVAIIVGAARNFPETWNALLEFIMHEILIIGPLVVGFLIWGLWLVFQYKRGS